MTALGVFHHGDPDWYYDLEHEKQTAVNAVLDLVESEDPSRFGLPIPMTGMMFGELRDLKLTRSRSPAAAAPARRITVMDGGRPRPSTDDEERAFAGAADSMMRAALLKSGWTEKKIGFWFTPDQPADLQALARQHRSKREGRA